MDNIFDSLLDNVSYNINGLDTAIENGMAEHGLNFLRGGCGMFLLANMANSYYNNKKQIKSSESEFKKSIEFQSEMQALQDSGMEERFREETAFKRAYATNVRINMLKIASAQLDLRRELGKIKYFLGHSWPLSASVADEMLTALHKPNYCNEPLHVIIMRPHLREDSKKECKTFEFLESEIWKTIRLFSRYGILMNYERGVCNETEINSGNASLMNIHFWLSPQPTLVISPKYDEQSKKMDFRVALWNIQTPRPMIRNLFSIPYILQGEKPDKDILVNIANCIATIVGITCDKYATFCLHQTPKFNQFIKENKETDFVKKILSTGVLIDYLRKEKEETRTILSFAPAMKELFSEYEIDQMSRVI